jgi:tetratricopeptide (TPR) repeat protein
VEILALAVRVAELLDPAMAGGLEAACDLQAEGWALLGNFSRLTADFEGARKAISKAWELHAQGTGDTVKQAFILALEASYICDLGEHEAAEAVLGQAMRIYRTRGELWLQGRTLIKMGDSIGKVDPEKGISHLRHGLQLIEASREPRLELCAQHDLACFLNELGKTEEAIDLLNRTRPLYKQFDDDWTQLRLRWLEGRIARSLKHLPEAIHVFRHLWESFRKRDLHYELVLVSLDLAEAQAANGDHEETATLTAQVHSIVVKWPWLRGALHNRWYGELWKRLGTPPCGS